jgi:RNA polymerase sigma-70 factor (ECF subfamily)
VVERVPVADSAVNEDAQLIDEALAGNSASFGQLVRRYQDRLYNTMVHVVNSCEEAQDVCQEAFVQAFVKLETFQRSSAFYTWLYRIAFNVAISRRRRRKPTVSVEQSREMTGEEPIDNHEPPHQRLEQAERVAQVQAALATLTEEHRSILILRELEGFAYETISELLDLPVGTVRSRLHRARLQLREQLKEMLEEEEVALDRSDPPRPALPRGAE